MLSESGVHSLLDVLASLFDEYKYGEGKNYSIIRSSSAVVSIVASALLVRILFRSRNRMQTTYHRLLLGLSISDILFSLSQATFGAVVPSEMSYVIWNARGNRASCDAFGFLHALGGFGGLVYMCSLNLYYLAKVKYNIPDYIIVKKLEPWLHIVPILFGLMNGVVNLATQSINEARLGGVCLSGSVYDPPHCDGYEDGEIPEGFEIPCGRGRSAEPIFYVSGIITGLVVPITMGSSLWTIYRSILRDERKIAQYGAGSLRVNSTEPTTNDAATTNAEGGGQRRGSIRFSAVFRQFRRRASRTSSSNQDLSQSRAVLHRATAYSVAYFVTWIWYIVAAFLILGGAWTTELPHPKWQINYRYVLWFFSPLQGLWTLLIYIQPSVIKRKTSSEGNVSWFRAFAEALWSLVTVGDNSARRKSSLPGPGALRFGAAPSRRGTGKTVSTISSTAGTADQQGIFTPDLGAPGTPAAPGYSGTNPFPAPAAEGISAAARAVAGEDGLVRPADEEEKCEIEPYEEDEEEKCVIEPYEEEKGRDDSFDASAAIVVGDGYESSRAHVFGASDPQGADTGVSDGFDSFIGHLHEDTEPQDRDTVVSEGFESFLDYVLGRTDPQGDIARKEPGGERV